MTENVDLNLSGVPETLLIPLHNRAMESQRPDAMMKDEKAVMLVEQMRYDFDRIREIPMNELLRVMRLILTREMDRYARDFLGRCKEAVVVHIGCGLDSRFDRVDNGQVDWYDLDVPEVIALRRKYLGNEKERYHLLACSVFEDAWLEAVKPQSPRCFLFLAETVLVYFEAAQVKSLVLTLHDQFPGSELVFEGWKPYEIWFANRVMSPSRFAGLMQWGFRSAAQIEAWGAGIHLLDDWGFFDQPEPRLESYRWMAPLFSMLKPIRIYHFKLGKTDE
jgi:O-methyltransferase involved in polyketide biosynthesis